MALAKTSDGKRFAFIDPDYRPPRRMVVSTYGMDKVGKTRLPLTAPGPIAILNFDRGLEGVIERFAKQKAIAVSPTSNGKPHYYRVPVKGEADAQEVARQTWHQFAGDFTFACESPDFRTLLVDSASQAWQVLSLGWPVWSPNKGDMARKAGENNARYSDLIYQIYNTDKNLILTHKMKDEYIDDKRTGGFEMMGYKDTRGLVQVNVKQYWLEKEEAEKREVAPGFHLYVSNCRADHELIGLDLANEEITFATLGMMVFPESQLSDWE